MDGGIRNCRLSDVLDVAVCEQLQNDFVIEKFGSPAYVPPEVRVFSRTFYILGKKEGCE